MKLLDITEYHSPVGGGVTTYLRAKARWLERRPDVEHVIVLSGARAAEERWHRSRVYYLGGPPVPASPGFYFFLGGRRLRAILLRERPDVIELGSPFFARWVTAYAAAACRPARLADWTAADASFVPARSCRIAASRSVRRAAAAAAGY